jgi:hypothetical protein
MSTETGLENLASGQTCFGLQGIFSQPILFVSRTGFQENIANMSHIFAAVRAERRGIVRLLFLCLVSPRYPTRAERDRRVSGSRQGCRKTWLTLIFKMRGLQ